MPNPVGNALIGQSGGPTAVINQSLVGVVETCLDSKRVRNVYGAVHGIQGLLKGQLIDLGQESRKTLEAVAHTPAAALRSVRKKPTAEDCAKILDAFQRLRCSFDPAGLAYPGKLMPTPRLCGEVPGPYRVHPLEAAGLAERF